MDEKSQDKFSDLHVDLKHLILRHLPTEEIARMSILCTWWRRHVIHSHPTLNFNFKSYDYWLDNQYHAPPFKSPADGYLKSILQIVSNHTGILDKFALYVPYATCISSHSLVQQIVSALPKTVKNLSIRNNPPNRCPLTIPNFNELTHLELEGCSLKSQLPANLLPKLTHLKLTRVYIPCDVGPEVFGFAPRLERLRLSSCYGPSSCDITIAVPSLTELFVDRYWNNVLLSSENSMLSSFTLCLSRQSRLEHQHSLHTLTRLEILDSHTLQEFCCSLSEIKLADDTCWALQTLILNQMDLKNLDAFERKSIDLIKLLQLAKNLRELWIKDTTPPATLWHNYYSDDPTCSLEGVTLDRLRTLSYTLGWGSDADLQLLERLLACSPVLENLNVGYSGRRLRPCDNQKVEKRISEFHKASPYATVTYLLDIPVP